LFVVTHVYRVPQERVDKFLSIEQKAMGIYLKHGCLGFEIFRSGDEWCMEINRFESKEDYESVMKSLNLEPEIEALWNEFCSLIGNQDILTKEYERIL
jgi:hypothetical protein